MMIQRLHIDNTPKDLELGLEINKARGLKVPRLKDLESIEAHGHHGYELNEVVRQNDLVLGLESNVAGRRKVIGVKSQEWIMTVGQR